MCSHRVAEEVRLLSNGNSVFTCYTSFLLFPAVILKGSYHVASVN